MPNTRKIFGINYYAVKKRFPVCCVQCGKRIFPETQLYAKDTEHSRFVFCRECIMRLSDQYHNETNGRIPFPKEMPLHIGLVGHFCSNKESQMIPQTAIFRRKTRSAIVPVFYCQECKRYFMGTTEYQQNCLILSDYNLHHTLTGKPFPGNTVSNSEPSSACKQDQDPKFPSFVVWSHKHPYQGGGCSGK